MATKAAAGAEPVEARDEQVEGMMLDTQSAAVKKLIARARNAVTSPWTKSTPSCLQNKCLRK